MVLDILNTNNFLLFFNCFFIKLLLLDLHGAEDMLG